jgi:hypothetical protein
MAEQSKDEGPVKKSARDIASADWLFTEEPKEAQIKPSREFAITPETDETFDLVDGPSVEESAPVAVVPPVPNAPPPVPRAAPKKAKTEAGVGAAPEKARVQQPSDVVEEVWTRSAEWGGTLLVLSIWLFLFAGTLYKSMSVEDFRPFFLILVLGIPFTVFVSYPMLITLERPVRITPEQAARDYYTSLAHHWPHYKRMWLLLSKAGRVSMAYGSFEGFKAYWKKKLKELRGKHAGATTPLVFEIHKVRGDKSAGKAIVDVEYELQVFVRGKRAAGPIATMGVAMGMIRGEDNMWYLQDGTIPPPRAKLSNKKRTPIEWSGDKAPAVPPEI